MNPVKCPICLQFCYYPNDNSVQLPCRHLCHVTCFGFWCPNKYTCPTCKKDFSGDHRHLFTYKKLEVYTPSERPQIAPEALPPLNCRQCHQRITGRNFIMLSCQHLYHLTCASKLLLPAPANVKQILMAVNSSGCVNCMTGLSLEDKLRLDSLLDQYGPSILECAKNEDQ